MPYGEHTYLVVKIVHLLTVLLIHYFDVPHYGIYVVLHGLEPFVYAFLNVLIQLVIFLLVNELPIDKGLKNNARAGCFQRKSVVCGNVIKPFYQFVPFLVIYTGKISFLSVVVFRRERLGKLGFEKGDEFVHIVPELPASSRFKSERKRHPGIVKVINIAPVIGHPFALGFFLGALSCVCRFSGA